MPHLLYIFMCEECVEEHLSNTQSISCYCHCHSSKIDKQEYETRLPLVLRALAKEREENS